MDELLDIENEEIVLEIRDLVNCVNSIKEEADIYCDLIKQMFLSGSGKN